MKSHFIRLATVCGILAAAVGIGVILFQPSPIAATPQPIVSGPPQGSPPMTLRLDESFDSPELDPNRWILAYYNPDTETPTVAKRSLAANKEREVFFDPDFLGLGIDPHHLSDSVLRMTARPLTARELAAVRAAIRKEPAHIANSALKDVTYASGMISSRDRFSQQYGYFEMRARWSAGRGVWPALWLLPKGGGWPPEIDIAEAHGDKPNLTFQSIHSKVAGDHTSKVNIPGGGTGQEFHTYGVMWTRTTIDYFIDGVKTSSKPTPDDMHVPMYVLASLAIGGAWPGDPDETTPNPAYLDMDFVRIWQFAGVP